MRPEGTQCPRASALSPIRTVFGHGLCNLCHRRIQLFYQCYSNGDVCAKTCTALRTRLQQVFIQYKALAVPLIRPRKVTQISQEHHRANVNPFFFAVLLFGEPSLIPKLLLPCVYDTMILQFYY